MNIAIGEQPCREQDLASAFDLRVGIFAHQAEDAETGTIRMLGKTARFLLVFSLLMCWSNLNATSAG